MVHRRLYSREVPGDARDGKTQSGEVMIQLPMHPKPGRASSPEKEVSCDGLTGRHGYGYGYGYGYCRALEIVGEQDAASRAISCHGLVSQVSVRAREAASYRSVHVDDQVLSRCTETRYQRAVSTLLQVQHILLLEHL